VFTPEQVRECLDRWAETGESVDNPYFWVPDGLVVGELSLDAITTAVSHAATGDGMNPPFRLLEDDP